LQMDDFVEVSGICTHPDYRGRGYAAALTRIVTQRLLDEGKTPFLHAYASNTGAIAVYERLGFKHRCDVTHAMWTRG
jgi:predicted GNAT family acetyltransferase